MNGKRTFLWLVSTALILSAFGRPPVLRPDSDARIIFQFLTTVNADGSAEFEYLIKYSKEQIEENLDTGGYSKDDLCGETTAGIESAIGTFSQETHGEDIWCTYSTKLDTLQGLNHYLDDGFTISVNRLEIEDKKFYLDLSWPEFPCKADDPSKVTCEWVVKAPGKVGENNATRVEGNTLTWDMSVSGTPLNFKVESAVGGGSDSTLAIVLAILMCGCCTVLLLIAGGAAVFFLLRKRKQSSDEPVQAEPPPPAPPRSPADTIIL